MKLDDLTTFLCSGSRNHIKTCSLVLSAVHINHQINADGTDFQLLVAQEELDSAHSQLKAYFTENKNWPPPEHDHPPGKLQIKNPPTILLMGGLTLFYLFTGPWYTANPWFLRGAVDTQALYNHNEWWRLFTALTLHADDVHMLGNLITGSFMVHYLCRTLGSGTGFFLILCTGALGNLCNVIIRDMPHLSVGFSTSIFGIIGIFTGYQIVNRLAGLGSLLAPLGAGAGLLAFLGTEGEKTDLGAHLFGFTIGILVGLLVRLLHIDRYAHNMRLQGALWLGTLLIIISCWLLAWNKV